MNMIKKYYNLMNAKYVLKGLILALFTTVGINKLGAQEPFDPQPPMDPQYHYFYQVTVSVSPEGAGSASGSGKFEAGTDVWINTSANSGYVFDHWEKDGVVYSDQTGFYYTMGEEKPKFVAFYTYDPGAPIDPENNYQPKKRLYLTCPQKECSFNLTSGDKQVIGNTIRVAAYPNQGYQITGWYLDDELLSASPGFDFVMPDHDVTLRVEVEYHPTMPGDPASQGGDIALESDNLDDIDPYRQNSLFYFESVEDVYTGQPFELNYSSKFNPTIKVLNGSFGIGVGSYTAQIDVTIKNDSMDTHRVFSYDYRILPAQLTITADNATKVYGADNPAFSYSAAGLVNGEDISSLTGQLSIRSDANNTSGVGDYPIEIDGLSSNNYDISYVTGILSVTPATLTVTANDATVTYGDDISEYQWSYSVDGFVNQDDALSQVPTFNVVDYNGNAGTYTIELGGAECANYDISYVPGTLTVEKSILTLTVANATKVYGESNPEFSFSVNDGAGNDMLQVLSIQPTLSTTATILSGVGDYEITAKGALSQNYSINVNNGILTVTKAPLTVTANDLTKVYGENNPELSYSIAGFVNNDNATVFTNQVRMSTEVNNSTAVGEYPIVAYNATADNYDISFVDGTLIVAKASLVITANDAAITYGDDISNFEWSYTVTGFVNNDTEECLTTKPTASVLDYTGDAGSYSIVFGGAESSNYEFSYVNGSLTVGQAALTLKVADATRVYGEENPQFGYEVVNAKGETISGALTVEPTLITVATTASVVGEYEIVAEGAASLNYSINVVNGILTVTKAPLTITAVNAVKVYGEDNPAFAYTVEGFINNDDVTCFTDNVKYNTDATKTSGTGDYAITPYGASAANYEIGYVDAVLSISKAPLIITVKGATVSYGYNLSNYTFQYGYEGFLNGDTEDNLTVKPKVDLSTIGTDVGNYTLSAYGAESANYEISYVNGTLTIGQSVLTLTVQNATKVYGEENPAFTFTVMDMEGNDMIGEIDEMPTLTTLATVSSSVGDYDITATGAVSHNFTINVVDGKLTVTKAPATVVAQNATKVYGSENPEFTYTVNGLIDGDDISAVTDVKFNTDADKASAVGEYSIIPYTSTAVNYEIIGYENAVLSVTKAPLTITVNDASIEYGYDMSNYQYEYSYDGFVNGDTYAVLDIQPTVSIEEYNGQVGTYSMIASGAEAANYEINYCNGVLTVGQAEMILTVDNATKVYGEDNPSFTYTATDKDGNDIMSALDTPPTLGTEANTTSGAGDYAITATGATSTNYSIRVVDGTLTVTKAPLIVKANNLTKVYGENNPDLNYSIEGLLNDDNPAAIFTDRVRMKTDVLNITAVGEYPIEVYNATSANYEITFVDGTFTITPAKLVVTVKNVTIGYGYNLNNYTFQFGYEGFVNGDTDDNLTVKPMIDFSTIGTDVGDYNLSAYGAESANYEISYVNGTLTIGQSVLTITVQNATKVYGEENPAFDYTVMDVDGNDMTGELDVLPTLTTVATTASGVGEYDITAVGAESHNFAINVIDGKLTVTKAPAAVVVQNATKLYGSENPDFTYQINGLVNNDDISVVSVQFNTDADHTSAVGEYKLSACNAQAVNYDIVEYSDAVLTITPAPLTISVKSVSVDYGYDMSNYQFEFTYEGFVNGDDESCLTANPQIDFNQIGSEIGTYPLAISGAMSQNYAISYVNGLLSVGQSVMVITVKNASMVYGSEIPEFTFTATDLEGNDLSSALDVQPTLSTIATSASGAGEYTISASGATSVNYAISYIEGSLTITKAPLVITPKDITFQAGDDVMNIKIEYTYDGLVNDDTEDCLTVKPKIKLPNDLSQSGVYDLEAYGAEAANYEITYGVGKLTVDKAVLFLAVKSVSREYGAQNPAFEYAVVDASGNNMMAALTTKPEIKCVATVSSPIGGYDIVAEGAQSDNYYINIINGKLQVTPATLTVTVNNAEFVEGAEFTFTYSITGFKNGEDESVLTKSPQLTCDATTQSVAGTYVITASGAEAANYVFVYENGTLNLTTGVIDIKVNGADIIYDITGKKIDAKLEELKPGLYIINGRKYVVQ